MSSSSSEFWNPERSKEDSLLIHYSKQSYHSNLPLSKQRQLLPIYNYKDHILYALEKYNVVLLVSSTGTGKSTQLTQFLYESGWASEKCIICTQPRRLAAISIASRVAQEIGCQVGDEVGYTIRFEMKVSKQTKIKYCTDGVLIREMMSDPLLMAYSVVIIDEAHQRSLNTDILFGLLKKILRKRPTLRVIIASATIDAMNIKNFFELNKCSNYYDTPSSSTTSLSTNNLTTNANNAKTKENAYILQIPSDTLYPVDICYLSAPCRNYITALTDTILNIHQYESATGDILVFLPGAEEIDRVKYQLTELLAQQRDYEYNNNTNKSSYDTSISGSSIYEKQQHASKNSKMNSITRRNSSSSRSGDNLFIVPLYANLPSHIQMQVFRPTPTNMRKVVLATNIAETSLTIEGIKFVIDSCLVKLNYYDFYTNIDMLITTSVSIASAKQRAGRCGRTQAGKCYRLITEKDFYNPDIISPYTLPEMQRVDITWSLLQLKALGIQDLVHFDYLSPPSVHSMLYSLELLYCLDAVDDKGNLTQIGQKMSEMPIEPKLSKCLLASLYEYSCTEEILSIVAMCSVENPWITIHNKSTSTSYSSSSSSGGNERMKHYLEFQKQFVSLEGDHITLLNIYQAFSLIYSGSGSSSGESSSSSSGGRSRSSGTAGGSGTSEAISWCESMCLQYKVLIRAYEIRRNLERLIQHYAFTNKISSSMTKSSSDMSNDSNNTNTDASSVSNATATVDEESQLMPLPIASCVDDYKTLQKCLLSSYFMNVAKLGHDGQYYTLKGNVRVSLHSSSVYFTYGIPPEWVMYNELIQHTTPQMRDVSAIEPLWLLQTAKHYYDVKNLTHGY